MNRQTASANDEPSSRQSRGYLRFIQTTVAVLVALLIVEVAGALSNAVAVGNVDAATVLLVVLVFVQVEVYVVLSDFHIKLELPYVQPWLYMDLLIALIFFWFATSVGDVAACTVIEDPSCPADLAPSMRVGVVVFSAFLIRVLVGYRLVYAAGRLTSQERLTMIVRSVGNVGGIVLSFAIASAEPDGFLGLQPFGWSLVAVGILILYFVFRAVPYQVRLARK